MKILILAPYPLGKAPSQRFRFEHFIKSIEDKGLHYRFQPFLSVKSWNIIYQEGNVLAKSMALIAGYCRRLSLIFELHSYQFVFIHRELAPFGPPIIEWLIAKVFRKKIIYDFDDAIWLPDQTKENPIWRKLKWRSKVSSICKWSWKVSAGNDYLATYARQLCNQVVVFPTVVDTEIHQSQKPTAKSQKPTIGWTGSHSTLFYLDAIVPILQSLEKEYDFEFIVIANRDPKLPIKNFRFVSWSKETEIEDLAQIDIGLMPLEDNEWAKGKCGFKLIQYLALGIPAVASPVGVNDQIILDDKTGYLAINEEEWKSGLKKLVNDPELRTKLGNAGRQLIQDNYSVKSQQDKFTGLFQ